MGKKEKKTDNMLLNFVEEQSDFSPASIVNIPYIQLNGRNYAEIEGIHKVLEVNGNNVVFKFKKECARISGEGLYIKSLTDNSAVVKGKITVIEFL